MTKPSPMFSIAAYGVTDVGLERKNNEDSFAAADDAGLYVVCDGMGGHASGELASKVAVESIVRFATESIHAENFRWPYQSPRATTLESRILDCATRIANREVFQQAQADARHKGMGTTVVALLLGQDQIGAVHVGDSRIYRMRDGELRQMTEDHSLLNHYRRTRPMTDDEIRNFKGKNVIVRAVGLRDTVEPETHVWDYRTGDSYMLCTDGLSDLVDDDYIQEQMLNVEDGMKGVVTNLVQKALAAGGKDNITVMVVHIGPGAGLEMTTQEIASIGDQYDGMEDTSPGFDAVGGDGFWDHETLPGLETEALVTIRAGANANATLGFDASTLTDKLPSVGAPGQVRIKSRTPTGIPGIDDDTPDGERPALPPTKKFARTQVTNAPTNMALGREPAEVRIRRTNPELAETEPFAKVPARGRDGSINDAAHADTDKYTAADTGLHDETPEAMPVVKDDGDS